MKLQKVTANKAVDALLTGVEAGAGFAVSNAAVGPVDSLVKNKMASRGIVAGLGLFAAIIVPNKHVQAVSGGMAAKQIWELGKEVAAPMVKKPGILADALEVQVGSAQAPEAMGSLRRALSRGRGMGNATLNPTPFKLGNPNPLTTSNGFVVG